MRLRCPCCGASMSLDALIAHDDARAALTALASLGDDLMRLTLKYLGLFRPDKTELSFGRVSKLIDDLLPDIRRGSIRRHGQEHRAPRAAWLWALNEVIGARARLELPLRNHAYLYQVLTAWRPAASRPAPVSDMPFVSAAPTRKADPKDAAKVQKMLDEAVQMMRPGYMRPKDPAAAVAEPQKERRRKGK